MRGLFPQLGSFCQGLERWQSGWQEQEERGGNGEEEREELASGNAMQGHQRHVADECEQRE